MTPTYVCRFDVVYGFDTSLTRIIAEDEAVMFRFMREGAGSVTLPHSGLRLAWDEHDRPPSKPASA